MCTNALMNRRAASGVTLIEILISLVVVSVGLLGVAGLHSLTLRNNFDALMRSQATALADDIADRMRANAAAVDAESDYNVGIGVRLDIDEDSSHAARDIAEWKNAIAAALPAGDGSVAIGADGLVTIRVEWGERASGQQAQEDTDDQDAEDDDDEDEADEVDTRMFFETQTEM